MLDKKFWFDVGPEVVSKFKKHTFMEAKDINDNKFPPYPDASDPESYGALKKANKLPGQASEFRNSTAPVMRGDLMGDWKMTRSPGTGGFQFGTVSHGGKVVNLAKKKRYISTEAKPIPDHINKYLMSQADRYTGKKLKNNKNFKDRKFKL